MQPTTVTITVELGDGADVAGILLALAAAGIDAPRPEATRQAPATVLQLAPEPPAGPTEQLELPLRPTIHHRHPVPRNYQPRDRQVAAWLASPQGQQLVELCRRWRKGAGSAVFVLDYLADKAVVPFWTFDHLADMVGVTPAIASASVQLLSAVGAVKYGKVDDHYWLVSKVS